MQWLYNFVPLLLLLQFNSSTGEMDAKKLSSSIAKFSAKFVKELDKSKSTVSSPLSAEFVLALLTLGTEDPSHGELLTALGIPSDDAIRSSFTSVASKLKSIKGVTLNVANKVYLMEGNYRLVPKMEEDAVKVFDAGIQKVNFGDSVAAAALVNAWVEEKTNKKIKDLVKPDDLTMDTRLVLVNAIYFKGSWKKKFDVQNTTDQPFFVTAVKTIDLPMMYMEDNFRYGYSEELQAQLLEMPYVGEEASMLIVLPKEIEGLDGVLNKLAAGHDLTADIDKMHSIKVQVTIPKFKIETEIDLNVLLPKLGIGSIFNRENSGLTKLLDNNEPLFVSKAIQKAFIEVNEEGAEAAAATAIGIMLCSAMIGAPVVPRFVADHPFLAVIMVDNAPTFYGLHRGE